MPALLTFAGLFSFLFLAMISVSRGAYLGGGGGFPSLILPPFDYTYFIEGAGAGFILRGLAVALAALLLASVPAAVTGYFLALKAPPRVRRAGTFLLLAAWVLTFERNFALLHFATPAFPSAWAPWLTFERGSSAIPVLALNALPPLALAAYSGFRGNLLGITWPKIGGTLAERLLHEAIPRAVAGLAVGFALAGASIFADFRTTLLILPSGRRGLAEVLRRATDHPTLSAAAAAIILAIVATAFLGALVVVWAMLGLASRSPAYRAAGAPKPEGRGASLSYAVTGIVTLLVFYSLFSPLAASLVASLGNAEGFGDPNAFSTRWYLDSRIGLLGQGDFWQGAASSLGTYALVSLVAAPLALLAAVGVRALRNPRRAMARGVLYFGMVVPPALLGTMVLLYAEQTIPDGNLPDPTYSLLAALPLALALIFVVLSAAEARGGTSWVGRTVAGVLVALAMVLNTQYSPASTNPEAFILAFLSRRIPTPMLDAAVVVLTGLTLLLLAVAAALLRGREAFRL